MAKKKKSAAQIRRMQERAEKRGESYEYDPPPEDEEGNEASGDEDDNNQQKNDDDDEETKMKLTEAAIQLQSSLKEIEDDNELKSKDRRTAKRKAEAIASEQSGLTAEELLKWLEQNPPSPKSSGDDDKVKKQKNVTSTEQKEDPETQPKLNAAKKLHVALKEIETNTEMKAKDRRSAKRKAEAIALEDLEGTSLNSVEELLEWYETYCRENNKQSKKKKKKNHDPYIAFIGQLSFDTTSTQLLDHIQSNLIKEIPKIKNHQIKIRILTDKKTSKSRGMAFVEVDEPDILYALLKLHQTFLNGRRMNVERSAGGRNKNSESRKSKLASYRKEQTEYFEQIVTQILEEYKSTGELRDDELDDGVIALCRRHSGPIVRAAVAKYIEGSGRDMDNPSAYLTFLITKFSEEGVYDDDEDNNKQKGNNFNKRGQTHTKSPFPHKRKSPPSSTSNDNNANSNQNGSSSFDPNKRLKQSSKFVQKGIDMSSSSKAFVNSNNRKADVTKIFPSARRGRGYMM